jgi:hypothetical protein
MKRKKKIEKNRAANQKESARLPHGDGDLNRLLSVGQVDRFRLQEMHGNA